MIRSIPSLLLAAILCVAALPAAAAEMLSGDQIKTLVAGNTIAGAMGDTDYAEYYQADGTIKADGYTGVWTIESDAMCFQYGSDPKSCWQVGRNGDEIQWIKDGKVDGTGMVQPGNPNNY